MFFCSLRIIAVFFVLVVASAEPNVLSEASPTVQTGEAPVVTKVEPPNWWVGLTPDLMVLLSGHGLQATKVACNLPDVMVGRTQATQGGEYLFVWLKFGPQLRSGTAVCRATTPTGEATFELPIAARQPTAQRFHGLSPDDVIYLIMPDRFADGDATNDDPS
jgi:hypothetical protein